jgi:transcriptional regulator with XRE-family HTH domain
LKNKVALQNGVKYMSLGQKIRTLRKQKHITQSELVGEEITRNMLSRIESDKALPSLPTLLFLAEKLEVSPGFLLEENASLFEDKKAKAVPALKRAFAARNYKEVLRLYEKSLDQVDDEIALMLAEASLGYAMQLLHKGTLLSAEKAVDASFSFCEQTIYPTEHIKAALTVVRAILRNVQSPKYEVASSPFGALREAAVFEDLYRYISEKWDGHTFIDPIYAAHTEAKSLMAKGRYADALRALEDIESKRAEKGFSVLVLFRVYADLELCHKELRNYEAAYRYSAKRMSLLSAFRT